MTTFVRVNSGNYAGQLLQLNDEWTAQAIADGWADDATEFPPEWTPAPEEVPESRLQFEAGEEFPVAGAPGDREPRRDRDGLLGQAE